MNKDTLLYIEELRVDVDNFSYKNKELEVSEIELTAPYFNIQKLRNEQENNLHFIIEYFSPKDTVRSGWKFNLKEIEIINGRFNYNDWNSKNKLEGIDYDHISISEINTKLDEIKFLDNGLACTINQFKLFEKSGFRLENLTTDFQISNAGIIADELNLKTPFSSISGDISFLTNNYNDLNNFIEKTTIKSYFNSSKLNGIDICYFVPTLKGLDKYATITGEIEGLVSDLEASKLDVRLNDGTLFKGSAHISGIPSAENLFLRLNVRELITSKEKLEQLPLPPFTEEKYVKLPDNLATLKKVRFVGTLTGFVNDFVAYGTFNTHLGSILTDIKVKVKGDDVNYKGRIETDHFKIGQFFGISGSLGDITMNAEVDGSGLTKEKLKASLVGKVEQIVLKNYEYNNIEVKGDFQDQIFNGYLAVQDENITFDFNGEADFTEKTPHLNFISNIKEAKLAKLNFIKSKKKLKTRFTTKLKVDLVGNTIDDMQGKVELLNSYYIDKIDSIYVGNILVSSVKQSEGNKLFEINSEIMNAKMQGKYRFKDLALVANDFLITYLPSFRLHTSNNHIELDNDFQFSIGINNSKLLSKIFFKGVQFGENTTVSGHYNSSKKLFSISGNVPQIHALGVEIDNCTLEGKTEGEVLKFNLFADKIQQNDSIYIDNFNLISTLFNDTLSNNFKWKNKHPKVKTEAAINSITAFEGKRKNITKIIDSYAFVSDSLWKIRQNNLIKVDSTEISIRNLNIASKNQAILIDGKLTNNLKDQLDIVLKNFSLLNIKKAIPGNVTNVDGVVNGVVSIKKKEESSFFTSNLSFNELKINENLIGEGEIKSDWNSKEEYLRIKGEFSRDHLPSVLFNGNYFPYKEENTIDLNLELFQTDLSLLNAYLVGFVDDVEGKANATIHLGGTFEKPDLSGEISLTETNFRLSYLNTRYYTHFCRINIIPDMISFDNVKLLDEKRNEAIATGTIFHEWFNNFSFDMGLTLDNFLALNTTEKDNKNYFGKAFVSGFADILYDGSEKKTIIEVDIDTEKNTVFNIPLSNSEDVVENDFIEFVSKDSSNIKLDVKEEIDLSDIEMNFDLNVTENAEVRLIFDDQIGDVMRGVGEGNLNLQINNLGDFNIYGNYQIVDGDYLFTLQNVINKRFDLENGGTISWNGDPYNAQLDITAAYRTRARLYDLLLGIDTSDIYKKRIPVDLKLQMKQTILNPEIIFDIDLPTADEDTRNKVKSILYVNDQEENIQELNKQVFSLLVLNRFLSPPNVESVSGNRGIGAVTSSELLSNQLSNWLSRISNDFDIGINYRPGDEISNQELELALSTQIFNDRLIIDSNFGLSDRNNISSSSQNTNNLIGDVTLEYKISKDGKVRVKAFNVSNQFSLEEINSPYTQGVGFFYKEEFDTMGEFFSNFFGAFRRKIN